MCVVRRVLRGREPVCDSREARDNNGKGHATGAPSAHALRPDRAGPGRARRPSPLSAVSRAGILFSFSSYILRSLLSLLLLSFTFSFSH